MTDGTEDDVPLNREPNAEQEAATLFETHEDREKRLRNEGLEQDITERRNYAKRSFDLTRIWIWFIILSTVAQFALNAVGRGLDRHQFIALITTTTGSVLGFWLLVGRYLFRTPGLFDLSRSPRDRNMRPSPDAGAH